MKLTNIYLLNKTSSRYTYSHLIYPIIPLRSIMGFPVVQLLRSCVIGHNYIIENFRLSKLGFPVVQLLCSCIIGHNYIIENFRLSKLGFPVVQLLRSCIIGHNYPIANDRFFPSEISIKQRLCK